MVTSGADDGGAGTLREVIAAAAPVDTITFDPDVFTGPTTITLTQGEIATSKNLTIQNTTGNPITISGNNQSRIFDFTGTSETISNLNFVNGNAPGTTEPNLGDGGAISSLGSLTLNSDTFSNNNAAISGGAIYNMAAPNVFGNVTVNGPNSSFTNNHAGSFGGAIFVGRNLASPNVGDSVTLTNAEFTSNSAGSTGGTGSLGGAVAAAGVPGRTTFYITGTVFNTNSIVGSGDGGAIYTTDDLSLLYNQLGDQSSFQNNTATNGGAIAWEPFQNNDADLTLTNATFQNNTAPANGGAVYCVTDTNTGQVNMTITGSLFNANNSNSSLSDFGGGLYVSSTTSGNGSSSVTLTNDTFYKNTADYGAGIALSLNNTGTGNNTAVLTSLTVYQNSGFLQGGGLWVSLTGAGTSTASVTLHNSIVAGNTIQNPPNDGPDVFFTNNGGNPGALQLINSGAGAGYNLIGIGDGIAGSGMIWGPTNIVGTAATPANPYLAPGLANNGGPTQTIAAVQPPPGARGAWQNGDPALLNAESPNNLDQRGFKRAGSVTIGAEDPAAQPQ